MCPKFTSYEILTFSSSFVTCHAGCEPSHHRAWISNFMLETSKLWSHKCKMIRESKSFSMSQNCTDPRTNSTSSDTEEETAIVVTFFGFYFFVITFICCCRLFYQETQNYTNNTSRYQSSHGESAIKDTLVTKVCIGLFTLASPQRRYQCSKVQSPLLNRSWKNVNIITVIQQSFI